MQTEPTAKIKIESAKDNIIRCTIEISPNFKENSDLKNLCDPKKVARFFAVQATHPTLRSEMAGILLTQDPRHLHDLPYTDDEIKDTIPAKMKDAYLSAIGLEILDTNEKDPYAFADNLKYTTFAELMKKAGVIPENSPLLAANDQ